MNNNIMNTINMLSYSGNLKSFAFNHVSEIIETASHNTLVLYKLKNDKKSLALFMTRIATSKVQTILVFCDEYHDAKTSKNIVFLKQDQYKQITELLTAHFYPNSINLIVAGITGTNGKSTVVHLCRSLCAANKMNAASIGTLGVFVNDKKIEDTINTTPGPIELAGILHRLYTDYNVKVAFIEVSSHALVQERLGSKMLDCVAWTSFGRDHLDFHKTLEEYFLAKALILNKLKSTALRKIIVPENDFQLKNKLENNKIPNISYKLDVIPKSVFFKIDYNQNNLSVAIGVMKSLNIPVMRSSILDLKGPKGRFEIIENKWGKVIVDYAHSPDGLESVLRNVKMVFPGCKVGVVFGCGGDRDNGKRPLMGKIANELADKVILTSDNPRSENPVEILKMITAGIDDIKKVISISDRKIAIGEGFKLIVNKELNVLVVAGKGHEEYQEINGVKNHFSDQDELMELIKKYENI